MKRRETNLEEQGMHLLKQNNMIFDRTILEVIQVVDTNQIDIDYIISQF